MGFTRSTTTTNVHSTLGDYPSVDDGLTPTQLKARFDSPATGLKSDLNGLMGELEATTAAASVGAGEMYTGDTSGANVQAKLSKLHDEIEAAALGEIPDNTITEAKLVSTYSSTLAKKNGNVQTNLNAEKLGGKTLATIESDRTTAINAAKTEILTRQSPADIDYTVNLTTSYATTTKTFSITSRFVLIAANVHQNNTFNPYGAYVLFDCRNKIFLTNTGSSCSTTTISFSGSNYTVYLRNPAYSNGTMTLDVYGKQSSGYTYKVNIRCMALDGLLP